MKLGVVFMVMGLIFLLALGFNEAPQAGSLNSNTWVPVDDNEDVDGDLVEGDDVVQGYGITAVLLQLKYDDGTSETCSSPWSDEPGSEIAVRFTPKSYPFALKAARFYIEGCGQPTTRFEVRIYRNKAGHPGKRLNSTKITAASREGSRWIKVDLSPQNIVINKGSFFISMRWRTAPGSDGMRAQLLGSDLNGRLSKRSYFKWGNSGDWILKDDRNMMIRACFQAD